jgi:alkyl hydroperoxide reductase subunit AhpC
MNEGTTITNLRVGHKTPEFEQETFEPSRGEFGRFSLKEQRESGQWTLLFFYPADFTFLRATEFAALAERQDRFERMGCRLVTVGTDTKFTHLAWQREEKELRNVAYSMAADPTGGVSRLFGVYDKNTGLALRGAFLIAPDGTLPNAEVYFYDLRRNVDEIFRKFETNLHLSKKKTEACPAKRKEDGDATLKPSAKMVGRVHEALQDLTKPPAPTPKGKARV